MDGSAGAVVEVAERNASNIVSLSDSMVLMDIETGHFFCVSTVRDVTPHEERHTPHHETHRAKIHKEKRVSEESGKDGSQSEREMLTSPQIPINEPRRAQEPQMFRSKVQVCHQAYTLRHERQTPFVVFPCEDGEEVYGHGTTCMVEN